MYNFGIGEMNPEIPVPEPLKQWIVESLMADENQYSAAAGSPDLLEALASDFANFGLEHTPSQFVVCPGPKDAIFKACLALLDPEQSRNRLLTFTPAYESFENVPVLVTGKDALTLPTDENFYPIPNVLAQKLDDDPTIKVVIVNSPNNPSGTVYPPALLRELADILGRHPEVAVISDEVYRVALYADAEYCSLGALIPEQTFIIGGMSKEVSGTGLRLGFVAGPRDMIKVIENVQGNATSCVHLPTQKGYARFLQADSSLKIRRGVCDQLRERRDSLLAHFRKAAPDASWNAPRGAFYFFPKMSAYLGRTTANGTRIETDEHLARFVVEQARGVTVPGSAFRRPGHLRFAYASSSPETIPIAMQRLGEALHSLE